MSLLLDALKRAEQEKLARQPGTPAPATPRSAPAPASGLELQPIASAPAHGPAGASAPPPRAEPGAAHAAQNVFKAKAQDDDGTRSRAGLWLLVGAVALVAIGAAAYVWYSVKSLTPQQSGAPKVRPVPMPPPAPTPPPASAASVPAPAGGTLPPPAAMGTIIPAPGGTIAPAPAGLPGAQPESLPPAASSAAPAPPAPRAPPESAAERLARAVPAAPPPMQLERSAQAERRVPAELNAGYDALRRGEWASARRAYEAALSLNPSSVDAHLGLATLAAREGNRVVAADHYRRALDFDPRNATATAGLAALGDFSRPESLEAQLRADIDRAPDSAALHFTLGNVHASQGRWTEAQSAYYEAHRLDPTSPEIAYNLAVSLDQLGQSRLAATFYRRALDGSRGRTTAFDPGAVQRRLAEIR